MGITRFLPWRTDDESAERPPKPDAGEQSFTERFDVYEVRLEYQNGDTETFETYSQFGRDGDVFGFQRGPVEPWVRSGTVRLHAVGEDAVPYTVLGCPPEVRKAREEVWRVSYEVHYEWEVPHYVQRIGHSSRWDVDKEWVEHVLVDTLDYELVEEIPDSD